MLHLSDLNNAKASEGSQRNQLHYLLEDLSSLLAQVTSSGAWGFWKAWLQAAEEPAARA